MDTKRWNAVEAVVRRNLIKPIVAIVPANTDPSLVRCPPDSTFWQHARAWEREGWMIALHGYSHSLRPSGGGLVPVNRRSEFVGLPLDEQRRRIREGVRVFQAQGIKPEVWVAPAHGLDNLTLEALRMETSISVISDSFTLRPTRRGDFVWIPQQLWRPRKMRRGLWTICLHPNEMDNARISALDAFIARHRGSFPDPKSVASRAVPVRIADRILELAFLTLLGMKKGLKREGAG